MATKNATKGQFTTLPLRLPRAGIEVELGVDTYHLATLTTWGTRDLQEFINGAGIVPVGMDVTDSIGMVLVNSAISTSNFEALSGLMTRAVFEPVDETIVYTATPDQLVVVVDTLLEQSGVLWLTRILKNSLARVSRAMQDGIEKRIDRQIDQLTERLNETPTPPSSPTGTENPPTLSMAS